MCSDWTTAPSPIVSFCVWKSPHLRCARVARVHHHAALHTETLVGAARTLSREGLILASLFILFSAGFHQQVIESVISPRAERAGRSQEVPSSFGRTSRLAQTGSTGAEAQGRRPRCLQAGGQPAAGSGQRGPACGARVQLGLPGTQLTGSTLRHT